MFDKMYSTPPAHAMACAPCSQRVQKAPKAMGRGSSFSEPVQKGDPGAPGSIPGGASRAHSPDDGAETERRWPDIASASTSVPRTLSSGLRAELD